MLSTNNSEQACCDSAYKVGQTLRKVVDIGPDSMRDIQATVTKEVRSNPLQATAIAAGIGVLIGLLLRRR